MTNDNVNETTHKLDYYSILKRRKRTVESFLAEHGIVSLEDLEAVLRNLSDEYDISEDFRKLAVSALPPVSVPDVVTVESPSSLTESVVDVALEPDADTDNVQKTKKRSKKEN